MSGRPCQCALAVFHKNVSNPSRNVESVIKRTLLHTLRFVLKASPGRGKLSPKVTDEGVPIAAVCLHPHPALRATFPRLGEGSCPDEGSAKNKSVYKKSADWNQKKGLLRGAAAPEGYVIAAQTSKLGSSFSMWMLDIKALCSGSVNSASFTYLFSTAAVRTGSAMVPAPPMQPPGQPMPSSR